ncbi:MAG TPA: VWA domain-containing protein, partial [Vicinamibacterales bacterium]|nr:VWA domain-containing protein [Vicinamibacterales bacterium]
MTARLLPAVLLCALFAAATPQGAWQQAAAAQDPQRSPSTASGQAFRSAADVVSVEVSVRREKRSVTGLTAADFDLLDNGVAQQIDTISYERLPIDVTVALDVSASVTGPVLEQLRRSVRQLQPDLGARDRLKLVAFNMRVERLVDFRAPGSVSDGALASLPPVGSSAIFDTLAVALGGAPSSGRRHLIIVFTDGKDSASVTNPEGLLEMARRSTPTIAAVLASSTPEQPVSTFAPVPFMDIRDLYDQLARETGGTVVYTHTD